MKRDIGTLSLAMAIAVSLGGYAVPAAAQSVEDLRAQINELSKRLEELEKKTEGMSPKTPAVTSGKAGVKLSLSGQVNRGVLFIDNGPTEDVFHVDNDNSSTRIRFIGSGQLDDDITVGTQIEVQFESNSTADIRVGQDGSAVDGKNSFTERKLELYVDSKQFGRLWLGQGDTASNGTSEVDLSGTSVVAYSGIADMAGGIAFSDSAGNLGPRINQAFSQFDGLSRLDRLRYDTPKFGGFKASVSAIEGGASDAALRFSGNFAGTKVAAAAAYANSNSLGNNGFEQYNGSVSVLLPVGVSLTGALGMREPKGQVGDDPFFYYGKIGYKFKASQYGATVVALDYTAVDDLNQPGDEFTAYGAFLVQNFDPIATEVYLGIRNHQLDRPAAGFDDILAILAGARVKF